ncbi:MAG: tetratricopeptide repeat protein [Thermodesulfobacteriota bacterium]
MTTASTDRKPGLPRAWLAPVVIAAAGLLAYANTFDAPFVFDDISNIVENPYVKVSGLTADEIIRVFRYASNRPVTYATLALNWFFHQDRVAGYHAVNLLIHILTAILVWLVTRETTALSRITGRFLPLGAALLWVTGPVLIQSVTYIIQRAASLAAFFSLLSLFCYIRARTSRMRHPDRKGSSAPWFVACGISLMAGLTSKEIAVLMPLFLLLYEWYFFQNLSGRWVRRHAPWIVLLLAMVIITGMVYLRGDASSRILFAGEDKVFTSVQRFMTAPAAAIYLLSLIAFPHPVRLNLDYDFPLSRSLSEPVTALAVLALISLAAAAVYSARRHRLFSYAVLWFLGNLAMETASPGLEVIYEHRLYLPALFPVIAFTAGLYRLLGDRRSTILVMLAMTVVLGAWTFQRNAVWGSGTGLWLDCARKSPGNARAFSHLGLTLGRNGQHPLQAIDYLNTALEQSRKRWGDDHPMTAVHHYNLAEIYRVTGNTGQAIVHYRQALSLLAPPHPGIAAVYNNLGTMKKRAGDMDGAMADYRKALEALPDSLKAPGQRTISAAGIYNNMAVLCAERGDMLQAEHYMTEALRLLTDEFGEHHPLTERIAKALRELTRNPAGISP